MRIPLAVNLESRDGTVSKDAKVLNGIPEPTGPETPPKLRKRPGVADVGQVHSGLAQLLYAWNGINTVQGDFLNRGTISTIVSGPSSQDLAPSTPDLMFSAQETGLDAATQLLMIKNRTQAWTVTKSGVIAAITLPSGLGASTYPITSITRVGTTATATLPSDAGLSVGDTVTVAGAVQTDYNVTETVLTVMAGSFHPQRDIPITITRSGTTVTATTVSGDHGLVNGSYVISGSDQSPYNGAQTITVTGTTTFDFTIATTTDPETPATGSPAITSWRNKIGCQADKPSASNIVHVFDGGGTLSNGDTIVVVGSGLGWDGARIVQNKIGNSFDFALGSAGGHSSTSSLNWTRTPPVLSSITRSGTTATINFAAPHLISANEFIKVGGATQTEYNNATYFIPTVASATTLTYTVTTSPGPVTPATGSIIVTDPEVTTDFQFTYAVAGSPATPATGAITVSTDGGTVPGIAYINGYFCIMDQNGVIFNSDIDDPPTIDALSFITAQNENGQGRAIAKSQSYLIAFKEWSTEFFYDAKSGPPGSPFAPVDNGFTKVGCAAGDSVVDLDGGLMWLSQTKTQGRAVHRMVGLEQGKVSTPDVERVLNADDLSTVYALAVTLDGHSLYVLTLVDSNITLVYDLVSQTWFQWSSYTINASQDIASITRSDSTATVVFDDPHGMADGDPLGISGADQSQYNGVFQTRYIDTRTVTFTVSGEPSDATGVLLGFAYTESYFKFTKYATFQGLNLFLHETDGHLYQMLPSQMQDAGDPINWFARSVRLDGGTNDRKGNPDVQVIGDRVSDVAMIRWSDDDCTTFKKYRPVNLALEKPELRRCGSFRRRTFEFRHTGNTSPVLDGLELEVK